MHEAITKITRKIRQTFRWNILRHLQRFFTGYSYDMSWDFQHHAAKKIYKIFKMYTEIPPNGAPTHNILENERERFVEQFGEDRAHAYLHYDGTDEYDEELEAALFARWKEILSQVLTSLKFLAVDDEAHPDHLYDPNPEYTPDQKEPFHFIPVEDKPEYHELIFHEDYGKTKINMERMKAFEKEITEGFRLMGLYWRSFWD